MTWCTQKNCQVNATHEFKAHGMPWSRVCESCLRSLVQCAAVMAWACATRVLS